MKIVEEFSKFAYEYNKYNVIQKEVAKKLITFLKRKNYKQVLDIGSGDGEIYRNLIKQNIEFEKFVAVDFSKEMLEIHPSCHSIQKICLDFNKDNCFEKIATKRFDLLLSSSALQWSEDITSVLLNLSSLADAYYFSFFTSNTFKTLHNTAKINSPICSKEVILKALNKIFTYELELQEYRLEFNSVHEMLRYIKRSGVSGGVEQLTYKQMKNLMLNYPLNYLEFEVLFINVTGKI